MTEFFSELDALEKVREESARKERELDQALAAVLATHEGRQVILWALRDCGTFASTTCADGTGTLCASVRRDVGLRILRRCARASKPWTEFLLKEFFQCQTAQQQE